MTDKIPYWLSIALYELGQHEMAGEDANNERIQEYLASVGLKDSPDEVPWCSAFVNWVLMHAGVEGTNLANARSWLTWGVGLSELRRGAVVVVPRGDQAWMGHVCFVLDFDDVNPDVVYVIGGNQRDRVSVSMVKKSAILGIRMPKEEPLLNA